MKAILTIEDLEGDSVNINLTFDPPIKIPAVAAATGKEGSC